MRPGPYWAKTGEAGSARGKKALVVGADIARYGVGTPGEPTQGAGAVALVVSSAPRLLALDAYTGTYAIVSHNRAFLDPIVTKVLEFVPGRVPRWYHGNMTYFLEKKAEERAAANAPAGRSVSGKSPSAQAPEDAG